ncbi:hypothetical protein BDN72DRAFT_958592 [Pluteus cervinus]|uniref:Uncharacterized protein n=1 Tax=Pluteus cervinus TaxID=181527 RepID=A0ACD3AY61_9AGAR|nr:hypothetical protein BDN72DRAFT_958592 [Pluteus cervinus]
MASDSEKDVDGPLCPVSECGLAVDVVIKTSDAKYFGAHLQNLENYAHGFPPVSFGKRKRTNFLEVEEDSEVVSLMLHFVHNLPQPDLRKIEMDILVRLAEAVEKYLMYSVMNTCRIVMEMRVREDPLGVLAYALKHNHHDVADSAAPEALCMQWKEIRRRLSAAGVVVWGEYREAFLILFREYPNQDVEHPQYPRACHEDAERWRRSVILQLLGAPRLILDDDWRENEIRNQTRLSTCLFCTEGWRTWIYGLARRAMVLPKFIPDCVLPVDIVVKTSDAKYFGTHLQSLESCAEGFPPSSLGEGGLVNQMDIEEDSELPQPDLRQVPIGVLVRLAEAVEKYLIYSSMSIFRLLMGIRAPEAPLGILAYALKHGYPDVADCAAPHSLGISWKEVRKELGPIGTALWGEYRESFLDVFKGHGGSRSFHDDEPPECEEAKLLYYASDELFSSPERILNKDWRDSEVDDAKYLSKCSTCTGGLKLWLEHALEEVEALPKFSTLL